MFTNLVEIMDASLAKTTKKIWTDEELADLFQMRDDGKTHKECAEKYGVSVSAMQQRQDRNPNNPEYRRESHKTTCQEFGNPLIGFCKRCGCVYKEIT